MITGQATETMEQNTMSKIGEYVIYRLEQGETIEEIMEGKKNYEEVNADSIGA